jgi:MerR family transcriptional regulator, light-induced transcriptional regulator
LARQAEGMSISRAVGLWRSLKEDNRDPLQVYPLPQPLVPDSTYSAPELGDTVIDLRNAWIDACMAFDERQAERVLTQAFFLLLAGSRLFRVASESFGRDWQWMVRRFG